MKIYKFKDCVLNTAERSVLKDGKRLDLNPKTFDVLQLLVERAGEIVTKDELLGKVWNGSFVEEGNLPVQVGKLRRLLGETPTDRFIETVAGIGYRFNSHVELQSEFSPPNGNGFKAHSPSESHRLYLKGVYFKDQRTAKGLLKAIEILQKAIYFDSVNVGAYVEIVHCFSLLYAFDYLSYKDVLNNIEPYLTTASGLGADDDLAQTVLGIVSLDLHWNFPEAEKLFRRALEINPLNILAHRYLSKLLLYERKFAESLEHLNHVVRLDPISVTGAINLGRSFYLIGMYENALSHLADAIELEPSNYIALSLRAGVLIEQGNYAQALELCKISLEVQYNLDTITSMAVIYAATGELARARKILEEINSQNNADRKTSTKLARIHLAVGDESAAYEYIERAIANHEIEILALKVNPWWREIARDSRFMALVAKVGIR